MNLTLDATFDRRHEAFVSSFAADLGRYFVYDPGLSLAGRIVTCLRIEGIWALFAYRLGRALRTRRHWPFAWAFFRALETLVRLATGIQLEVEAVIAPGFYIGHCGAIYVGPGVRIGRNSSIAQSVFLSATAPEGRAGAPVVGERVFLGAGCKVMGGVRIGDGAVVGANAVVLDDVPASAVVVGVPARVVGFGGSGAYIYLGEGEPPPKGEELLARR